MPYISSPKRNLQLNRLDGLKTDIENPEITDSAISLGDNFNPATDSLHASMRPIIVLANCFSLLPVVPSILKLRIIACLDTLIENMTILSKYIFYVLLIFAIKIIAFEKNNIKCCVRLGLRPDYAWVTFTWRSPKLFYNAVSFLGAFIMTVFNVIQFATTGISSTKTTSLVFYGTSAVASLLFLRLAKLWPRLALTWEKLERELMPRHRKVSKISLAGRFKLVTAIVMTLALIEHTLSILKGSSNAVICAKYRGDNDILAVYFQSQFPQVFSRMSYSLWKAILVDAVNILSTFSWNFIDLFLILISMALADQFKQLNSRLNAVRGKEMPEWWWAEARNDYNHLASLTRRVDSHISTIVFLSFAIDLYFICIQLLFSFNLKRSLIQKIYFCFSFGFLLSRTTAVSLYAASVHDESRLPAPMLYSVSSASYSTEVMRFLTQVTTDNISLTGMKFFSVTRGLVLTVAGTIVTYELVLVQINNIQQTVQSNATNICEVDDEQLYNNGSTVLL